MSKAWIIDTHATMSKSRPADDSQTPLGPWNVQRPFSDIWTSNGAQLCQSNSPGCGIYWLSQAKREMRGESKTRFSLPYQFLFCQSGSHQLAQEKRWAIFVVDLLHKKSYKDCELFYKIRQRFNQVYQKNNRKCWGGIDCLHSYAPSCGHMGMCVKTIKHVIMEKKTHFVNITFARYEMWLCAC